jgi:hypothetical protein
MNRAEFTVRRIDEWLIRIRAANVEKFSADIAKLQDCDADALTRVILLAVMSLQPDQAGEERTK